MGTKNNPGDFDCYEAAEPDEPMFVLLGRDLLASDLVYEWVRRREVVASIGGPTEREAAKIAEARACADSMRLWKGLKPRAAGHNTEGAAKMADEEDLIAVPRALLESIVDAEECWFDHHGGCQAHMFLGLEGEPCPMKVAQELLAAAGTTGDEK